MNRKRVVHSAVTRAVTMLAVMTAWTGAAAAASLQEITNFGDNPSSIKMYLYVPNTVKPKPPILVGVHWCHGTGPDFYTGTKFASLADKYGFIIIYPSASSVDGCWDVHSPAALTHAGGSDPAGIIAMVKYVEQHQGGDPDRVYVAGHSSGGMMTNVLLGAYPEVFKAGAAFAGVPFSCFAGTPTWSTDCATGKITKTASQWGDVVRAAYPGYVGPRPRVQLWHGTADDTLDFHNFGEEIKLWTNVLGVSELPSSTENDAPQAPWTRTRYANSAGAVLVEAVREQGEPHNLQIVADQAVHFFGLDGSGGGPADAGVTPARDASAPPSRSDGAIERDSSGTAEEGGAGAGGGAGSGGSAGTSGGSAGATGGGAGATSGSAGTTGGGAGASSAGTSGGASGSSSTGGAAGQSSSADAGAGAGAAGGGSAVGSAPDASGCSCRWSHRGQPLRSAAAALGVVVVLALSRRRRRS